MVRQGFVPGAEFGREEPSLSSGLELGFGPGFLGLGLGLRFLRFQVTLDLELAMLLLAVPDTSSLSFFLRCPSGTFR